MSFFKKYSLLNTFLVSRLNIHMWLHKTEWATLQKKDPEKAGSCGVSRTRRALTSGSLRIMSPKLEDDQAFRESIEFTFYSSFLSIIILQPVRCSITLQT